LNIDRERNVQWQRQCAQWRQDNQDNKQKEPTPPKPPRCVVHDSTTEKLAEILSRDPSGVLMHQDELAGWIGSFERYSAGGSSRAFFLTAWNGGFFQKDRVGKGKNDLDAETSVDNLAISILGGIQPDKLDFRDLTSDGLLTRILPVLMTSPRRKDEYHRVDDVEDQYETLIRSISNEPQKFYQFSKEALPVRDRVMDYLFNLKDCAGFSATLRSAIGKLENYYIRICLVLHVAKLHDPLSANETSPPPLSEKPSGPLHFTAEPSGLTGPAPIWRKMVEAGEVFESLSGPTSGTPSRQTAEAVEKLLREFLLPHIIELYDVVSGGRDRDVIRALANFILTSEKDRLRPSDVTAGVFTLRGEPEHKVREWVSRFCAMGWLEPEEDQRRLSLPPKAWYVVSGLREYFAERGKQAAAAKGEAHAILKAGRSRRTA
jgi:hypothetical protein